MNNNNTENKSAALMLIMSYFTLKPNSWVLAHPAILCHRVHLHLPGTSDELGDDHRVLLGDTQQQFILSADQKRQRCPKTSVHFLQYLNFNHLEFGVYYTNSDQFEKNRIKKDPGNLHRDPEIGST